MENKHKLKRANWAYQTQTNPPNFGKAKFLPRLVMNFFIFLRRKKNIYILKDEKLNKEIKKGLVSVIILSCKRLEELKRLINSLDKYFKAVETYKNIEFILVDNGSEKELINWANQSNFFNKIIHHKINLGMAGALNDAYKKTNGEYVLLLEDDFYIDYKEPFIMKCLNIFNEFPEIGIIRLKNQNNWGKKYRIIGPIRKTKNNIYFWTWFPSLNGKLNVWAAGSVMFRKISFLSTGEIKYKKNISRNKAGHQGYYYEEIYGKKYNKFWLAAKIKNCYPFIQPNDNDESPGWNE